MSKINRWDEMELIKNPNHPELYQKNFVTASDADDMKIALSSVLYERLKYHGAVTPHYHSVYEIICITKGEVMAYNNGKWGKCKAGDVIMVPAGEVHSVVNLSKEVESEQISIFIPESETDKKNEPFETFMVDEPKIEDVF